MNARPLLHAFFIAGIGVAGHCIAQSTPSTPPAPPATPTPATPPATAAPAAPAFPVFPAAPAEPPPPPPPSNGIVKVGGEFKRTIGRVLFVERGDNGCYLSLKDPKGNEFIEIAGFDKCAAKPPLKGKQVELEYKMETIQASSCYGDPKCKKTETVPLVINVKVLD